MPLTPEQDAALAAIAAAVHETHAQQQRISASAAILAASLGDAPPPPPAPTYAITASAPTVDEGGSITYTVTTTHVPAGTVIGYTLRGGIDASDVTQPLAGAVTIGVDGTASVTVDVRADALTEGDETVEMALAGDLAMAAVLIRDTSTPPPPAPGVGVQVFSLNPATTIVPEGFMRSGTGYERFQIMSPVDGDTFTFRFRHADRRAGWREFWPSPTYTLLVDGAPHAEAPVPAVGNVASIPGRPPEMGHGWHMLTAAGTAGETCYPWPVFVRRNPAAADPELMPVVRGSFDGHGDIGRQLVAWVPARFDPVVQSLAPRVYEHFSAPLMRKELYMTMVAPLRPDDLYRPRRVRGVLNTANRQGYLSTAIHPKLPAFALLDGKRGLGTISAPTFIHVGREDADGQANLYVIDGGYRLVRIAPDGTITTLVGWRHKGPEAANNDPPRREDFECVGDWRMPAARHGLHEAWFMLFDPRTTGKGSGAPIPNPPRGLEPPHDGAVVAWIVDTQNDRVLRATFNGQVHGAPAVVEEFITGLADPWAAQFHEGMLIIAERTANRLSKWDADTGAFIGVLLEGPAGLAQLNPREPRRAQRLAALDEIRKSPCCMPECLRIQDGWAYYSSFASQDIKRVNLATAAWESYIQVSNAVAPVTGSQYLVFDLSDGTVGPRGSAFINLWTSMTGPLSAAYLPDGTAWSFWNNGGNGPGMTWVNFGYGSAVGVGKGRVVCGWSNEGLGVIGKARGEKTYDWDRFYKRATDAWARTGLFLTHGPGGFGYYGLPLPWGVSPDTDTYLEMHGHSRS